MVATSLIPASLCIGSKDGVGFPNSSTLSVTCFYPIRPRSVGRFGNCGHSPAIPTTTMLPVALFFPSCSAIHQARSGFVASFLSSVEVPTTVRLFVCRSVVTHADWNRPNPLSKTSPIFKSGWVCGEASDERDLTGERSGDDEVISFACDQLTKQMNGSLSRDGTGSN